MTLATTDSRFSYSGDGTTTAFSFPRKYVAAGDLKVVVTDEDDGSEAAQTISTHYTVTPTGAADSNGVLPSATITFVTAPGSDKKVIIYRDPALTNETDFVSEGNALLALNRKVDLLTMQLQRLDDARSRSLRMSEGFYSTFDPTIPDVDASRATAGHMLALTAGLTGLEWVTPEGGGVTEFRIENYDTLQDAIDDAFAHGSGAVVVDRDIDLAESAVLKDYVVVRFEPGVTITWTGGAAPMFKSASDNVILHAGIIGYGATLAMGASATKCIELNGGWGCSFKGFRISGSLTTSVAIDVRGDSSGGSNPVGGRHSAYCKFEDIVHEGVCGTLVRLYGDNANSGYVTLNTFANLSCEDARGVAIDFAKWCDHNKFTGITSVIIKGNDSIGAVFNSADPTNNVGVYANNFDDFAVSCFGSYTGRIGIKINHAKATYIAYYYNYPTGEAGHLVTSADTGAYYILYFAELAADFQVLQKALKIPPSAVVELAGRNVLLNGCARVWLQGTSFTSASTPANNDDTYLAEQVILLSDGNDIIDFSKETTVIPTGAYASFKLDVETANKKFGLLFPVEAQDAARLIGGNAVASFQARKGGSNATAETLRAAIISWQGTADAITSDVVSAWESAGTNPTLVANWTYETAPQNITLTTSFVKFDEDNGLAGAIDTASTKQLALFIWCDDTDATVGDLLYISQVQLEAGLVATSFEHRPFSEELLKCRRYFNRDGYAFVGEWLSATTVALAGRFAMQMRTTPVVSLNANAPVVAEVGVANRTGVSSTISIEGSKSSIGIVSYVLDGFTSATAGNAAMLANNCFDFDARL